MMHNLLIYGGYLILCNDTEKNRPGSSLRQGAYPVKAVQGGGL